MKITDLTEETLFEAPVSGIGQSLRKIGAGAANMVGARGLSSRMSGQIEAGEKANRLYFDFNRYLGRIGKTPNDAAAGDLKDFLRSKRISDQYIELPDEDTLSKSEIENLFMAVARDSYRSNRYSDGNDYDPANPDDTPFGGSSMGSARSTPRTRLAGIKRSISTLNDREKKELFDYLKQQISGRIEPTMSIKKPDNVVRMPIRKANVAV